MMLEQEAIARFYFVGQEGYDLCKSMLREVLNLSYLNKISSFYAETSFTVRAESEAELTEKLERIDERFKLRLYKYNQFNIIVELIVRDNDDYNEDGYNEDEDMQEEVD